MNTPSAATLPQPKQGLFSTSFLGFLTTQFLGAFNDNMFRWLVASYVMIEVQTMFGNGTGKYNSAVLSTGAILFTLPYILFASYAGYLSDRFSKRLVTVWCKVAEIVIMAAGVAALWFGDIYLLMFVVMLMGTQSALFSPAKLGIIPELVPAEKISAANGVVGLTTIIAIVMGTTAGYALHALIKEDRFATLWIPAVALVGVAIAGWLCSLLITQLSSANSSRSFPMNPFKETFRDLQLLAKDRSILRVSLGIAFFWTLATLAQMNIDSYAKELLKLEATEIGLLMALLSMGVGLGSILAGYWSGDRVELGIVPLGAMVMAICSILLCFTGESIFWTSTMLFLLGLGGGLFSVPLSSFLQHRSPPASLGSILAAGNFITFAGTIVISLIFPVMCITLQLSPKPIFLLAGLGTIPVALYVIFLIPSASIRFFVWLLSHTIYRVKVKGHENLPETGGALLVANHVSWLDGILLLMTSSRPIRMLAYADYVENKKVGWLARIFDVIPIKSDSGPKELLKSLKTANQAIKDGELVCIFAEGQITRTGQLQPFQRGMMRIVQGTGAPVVPVYLEGLWGSIFSYERGKFFWKMPRRWPYPISILFGKPLHDADNVEQVRQAVQELGVEAVEETGNKQRNLPQLFVRQCKRAKWRTKVAESSGTELTGGKLLSSTLLFKRLFSKGIFAADEKRIGVLLPPGVGGVIANTALAMMGKVAVNLNYTLSDDVMDFCIQEAGIQQVITSRKFLEKKPMNINTQFIYLEDLKEQISGIDKLIAATQAYVFPSFVVDFLHGLKSIQPEDLLTIIFTSGSTGNPKGVMLSHKNIGSNIRAINQSVHISQRDVLLGVLPFFHSFGFTGTFWLAMGTEASAVYHYNPLDSRTVGKLSEKYQTTILFATPTFLRSYLKRCTPEQFATLELVVLGAEKMPVEMAAAFEEKFGIVPCEGYGTTELSPVVSVNIPASRCGDSHQSSMKLGTIGKPLPGIAVKIINPDSGKMLGIEQEGLLLVKGSNVMQGYLNQPEKTAELIVDGWYNTGDIAKIDNEGFVIITGRQSRFSKIGGEMVPHIRIEAELAKIVEDPDSDEPDILIAVAAVPHKTKGERIVVAHKPLKKPIEEILNDLAATGLPNLWLPSRDSFFEVSEIPVLGTGKLDLKQLKELALKQFGE